MSEQLPTKQGEKEPLITISSIIKLLVLCFLVGWGMTFFEITPEELIKNAFSSFRDFFDYVVASFGSLASYALLGAVIVVPIWAFLLAMKMMRRG
jgi:Na+/H+-dicarboxylate symporter